MLLMLAFDVGVVFFWGGFACVGLLSSFVLFVFVPVMFLMLLLVHVVFVCLSCCASGCVLCFCAVVVVCVCFVVFLTCGQAWCACFRGGVFHCDIVGYEVSCC